MTNSKIKPSVCLNFADNFSFSHTVSGKVSVVATLRRKNQHKYCCKLRPDMSNFLSSVFVSELDLHCTMGNFGKICPKTFSCKVEFKPVTSRIFKCQSNLAIKFYSYFWWISRNLNKVLKNHRNFAFYQSFGRIFQVFLTYTLSEHVRACNFKTGKCIIT